jgi:hypothetical protein
MQLNGGPSRARRVALGVLVTMLLLPLSACIRVSDLHVNSANLVLIPGIAGEYFDSIDNDCACVGQADGSNYRVWFDKNRWYGAKTSRVAFMSISTASDGTRIFLGLDMDTGGTSAELFELQVSNGTFRWGVLDFKTVGPGILEFVRRLKNQYNLVISGTSVASLPQSRVRLGRHRS